jgi:hypothetical protein
MKEITRRLYTKPVMLSLSLLVGMVLLVALFVTANSRAASTFIPAGDDKFETTNNGETYHNFNGQIQQGFFNFDGAGTSDPYNGTVPLEGVPLPGEGNIDTIIHRNQGVSVPGTTSLTMTALSLRSINSITVTYSDRPSEQWTVKVGLSDLQASTGSMSISDGGTFDSTLSVFPKFTFTRVSDGAEKYLDTGGGSGFMSSAVQLDTNEGDVEEPTPLPQPAPCKAVATDFETQSFATASSSCPPVTLTSSNSPWQICADGKFCIPRPITEQELLASHNASPPGTKKKVVQVDGVQQTAIR